MQTKVLSGMLLVWTSECFPPSLAADVSSMVHSSASPRDTTWDLQTLECIPTHSLAGNTATHSHRYWCLWKTLRLKSGDWRSHQYPWLLRSAKTAPDSQPIIVPWITPATGPLPSTTTSPFILHLANISAYNNLSSVSSTMKPILIR